MSRDQKPARFKTSDTGASGRIAPALPAAEQPVADGSVVARASIAGGPTPVVLAAIFLISCAIGGFGTTLLTRLLP